MSVIRAFIAVEIPTEIQRRLSQITAQLRPALGNAPVRWVAAENVHLTLRFLGDVSLASLDLLKKMLHNEAGSQRPFDISVGGIGAFPSNLRPRIIWAGLQAPPDLAALQTGIESGLERLGYASDGKPFSPHLTLGRVSRNATNADVRAIGALMEKTKIGFLGAARVEAVHLFRSDLHPSGAVYTRLFSAPFKTAEGENPTQTR